MSLRFRSSLELPPHLRAQVEQGTSAKPAVPVEQPRRQKYGNQVTEVDGERYESKWEMQRYGELQEQERQGLISDLRRQVEFALDVRSHLGHPVRICCYVADAVYRKDGATVVEDTKSEATRKKESYRIKAKLFEALYGLKILEVVRAPRRRKSRVVTA